MKIFRKIRLTILSEGKTWRYVKYAIGEIVLVMIGILLALQVNDWNTNRLNRIEERKLLNQLKIEFLQNQEQLLIKVRLRKNAIESSTKLLNFIDNPNIVRKPSQIDSLLANTIPTYTFDPSQGSINLLFGAGKLSLIKNDSLRQQLSNWSSILAQLSEEEEFYINLNHRDFRPMLYKYYTYRNIINELWHNGVISEILLSTENIEIKEIGKSSLKVDMDKLLTSSEFEGILSSIINFNLVINAQSHGVNEYINGILKIIERELKTNP